MWKEYRTTNADWRSVERLFRCQWKRNVEFWSRQQTKGGESGGSKGDSLWGSKRGNLETKPGQFPWGFTRACPVLTQTGGHPPPTPLAGKKVVTHNVVTSQNLLWIWIFSLCLKMNTFKTISNHGYNTSEIMFEPGSKTIWSRKIKIVKTIAIGSQFRSEATLQSSPQSRSESTLRQGEVTGWYLMRHTANRAFPVEILWLTAFEPNLLQSGGIDWRADSVSCCRKNQFYNTCILFRFQFILIK